MTRADYLVVIAAIALLPFLYFNYWGNSLHGEQVVIRIAQQPAQYYSLYDNQRLTVAGALGDSIIEIRDAQVRFLHSPCQGKQCIQSGWLNKDGDVAACLPNGVSVQVVGRDNRFDSINF